MSFSDIISIVSKSIFRVFSGKIYGQEIHDENQQNKARCKLLTQQLWIRQCRGLAKKIITVPVSDEREH